MEANDEIHYLNYMGLNYFCPHHHCLAKKFKPCVMSNKQPEGFFMIILTQVVMWMAVSHYFKVPVLE